MLMGLNYVTGLHHYAQLELAPPAVLLYASGWIPTTSLQCHALMVIHEEPSVVLDSTC